MSLSARPPPIITYGKTINIYVLVTFCTDRGCPDFLKSLLKRGEDFITFIDKSLYLSYAKSTWWIDSGAIVHVANSLQGFRTRRTLQRGERRIKVANGVKPKVEVIVDISLELDDSFRLQLLDYGRTT